MIGSSSKSVKTCPRLPRLNIFERFFKGTLLEKNPKKDEIELYFT